VRRSCEPFATDLLDGHTETLDHQRVHWSWGVSRDGTLLIAGQGVRAAGYGFTAVVLGAVLAARGYGTVLAGVILTALIAGTGLASLLVGAVADRVGRRRCYVTFFLLMAGVGAVLALGAPAWVMVVLGLSGTISTDVVDNGAATTLEQVMLAREDAGRASVYGRYNAVGAASGAVGAALAAAVPESHVRASLFAVLVPVGLAGAVLGSRISPSVEAAPRVGGAGGVQASKRTVRRLSALFAVDAAGGGFVTTGFLSYYFTTRYGASLTELGWLFFAVTVVQAASVAVAPLLAHRFGLVATMVGTHLPSNLLLASVAFAPSLEVAAALLLARTTLSQMDVPTRQALVMNVVRPEERTAAAARTNAARYAVRPAGPALAGLTQQLWLGAPLLIAGVVKGMYDVALWRFARPLPLVDASS
jgi:MFS family permease